MINTPYWLILNPKYLNRHKRQNRASQSLMWIFKGCRIFALNKKRMKTMKHISCLIARPYMHIHAQTQTLHPLMVLHYSLHPGPPLLFSLVLLRCFLLHLLPRNSLLSPLTTISVWASSGDCKCIRVRGSLPSGSEAHRSREQPFQSQTPWVDFYEARQNDITSISGHISGQYHQKFLCCERGRWFTHNMSELRKGSNVSS